MTKFGSLSTAECKYIQREVNLFTSLEVDEIVQSADMVKHDENLFVFNEHLNLGQLSLIAKNDHSEYNEDFCRHALICVTRALSAMHKHGIVHGDVCAANVFCSRDG